MPTSWHVKRKNVTFTTKPNCGSYRREFVVPIVVLLRDELKVVRTLKEAKYVVNNTEIEINGKIVKDVKFPVGIFDVVCLKKSGERFVVLLNKYNKISLIPTQENSFYMRVGGKSILRMGKFQINTENGYNFCVDKKMFDKIKVSDTIEYNFVDKKIEKVIPFKKNSLAYIFSGKFVGNFCKIIDITSYNGLSKKRVDIEVNSETHSTAKEYCLVLGDSENVKKLQRGEK